MFTIPARPLTMTFVNLVYGGMLMFWLSLEDNGIVSVSLLGMGAVLVFVGDWLWRRYGDTSVRIEAIVPLLILLGGLFGTLANLVTVFLMFFKTAWHAHLFPDYPNDILLSTLQRLPVWAGAGALLGLAIGLFVVSSINSSESVVE